MSRQIHFSRYVAAIFSASLIVLVAHAVESGGAAGDPYPLGDCPVSGEPLGSMGEPVAMAYDGRQVQFCCAGCTDSFENHEAAYWAAIDDTILRDQAPVYPLDTCVIDGEPLEAGEGHDIIYRNRLVRLASTECEEAFLANPGAALSRLDEAVVDQELPAYPTERCAVSGEELGSHGDPINYVIANRLVRVCCAMCAGDLRARPAAYYPNPREAAEQASQEPEGHDHSHEHNHGEHDHGHGDPNSFEDHDEHEHGRMSCCAGHGDHDGGNGGHGAGHDADGGDHGGHGGSGCC